MVADANIRPGDMLAGKYRVEKVLGSGAMGVVVSALHVELHERRAIKFMRASMLADAEAVERFLREARSAVRLKSVHVAKIHDIGRLENGAPYMVMEHLDGNDLKQVLENRGALPVHEAVGYMLQICEAIGEAHQLGIVHRDLKPANLFVTRGANGAACVKVLDFGIAKLLGNPDGVEITQTSNLMGTPLYMSPEQMRGAQTVDGRSDIWALGAILYRLLTNRTPFEGSSVTEICAAVVTEDPIPPSSHRPEVPPMLQAAILLCLEKDASKRFATVAEFARAIAPFANAEFAAVAASHAMRVSAPSGPGQTAPHGSTSGAVSAQTAPRPPQDLSEGSLAGSESVARGAALGLQPAHARRQRSRSLVGPVLVAIGLLGVGGGGAAFLMTRGPESSSKVARDPSSATAESTPPGATGAETTIALASSTSTSSASSASAAASSASARVEAPPVVSTAVAASSAPASAAPAVAVAPPITNNAHPPPADPVVKTPPASSSGLYDRR